MPAANFPNAKPVVHPGTYAAPVTKRRTEPMIKVWSPDGKEEEHAQSNARDLVRSCGYTTAPPGAVCAPAASADPEENSETVSQPEDTPDRPPASRVMEELFELRAKLAELTKAVPPTTWGKNRLKAEIAKAEAENSGEADAEVKEPDADTDAE